MSLGNNRRRGAAPPAGDPPSAILVFLSVQGPGPLAPSCPIIRPAAARHSRPAHGTYPPDNLPRTAWRSARWPLILIRKKIVPSFSSDFIGTLSA